MWYMELKRNTTQATPRNQVNI